MRYLIILSFLCICACQKTPTLTIEQDLLVNVLTDIHIAEASILNTTADVKDSLGAIYYEQIYKIHGVSEKDFKTCVEVLKRNPKLTDEVYQKVLDKLAKDETQVQQKKKNKNKENDDSKKATLDQKGNKDSKK